MAIMRIELKEHVFETDPGLVKSVRIINQDDKFCVQITFDSGVSFDEQITKTILSNTSSKEELKDVHGREALLQAEVASEYIM